MTEDELDARNGFAAAGRIPPPPDDEDERLTLRTLRRLVLSVGGDTMLQQSAVPEIVLPSCPVI